MAGLENQIRRIAPVGQPVEVAPDLAVLPDNLVLRNNVQVPAAVQKIDVVAEGLCAPGGLAPGFSRAFGDRRDSAGLPGEQHKDLIGFP